MGNPRSRFIPGFCGSVDMLFGANQDRTENKSPAGWTYGHNIPLPWSLPISMSMAFRPFIHNIFLIFIYVLIEWEPFPGMLSINSFPSSCNSLFGSKKESYYFEDIQFFG